MPPSRATVSVIPQSLGDGMAANQGKTPRLMDGMAATQGKIIDNMAQLATGSAAISAASVVVVVVMVVVVVVVVVVKREELD